jgi:hypothetical protein
MNPSMNRWLKRFLTVAVIASLAVIGTSAIALSANTSARSGDPLQGIAAVANSPAGVTDSTALTTLNSLKARHSGPIGGQLLEQARLLPTSISGRHLYLVPSTSGDICMFVQAKIEACTSPLTASHPALFSVVDPDGPGGTGPVVFGVAKDGVSTISFTVAGVEQTVPVKGNVFEYQAASSVNADDITNATATSTNGQDASLG